MSTITAAEIFVTERHRGGGIKKFDAYITEHSNPWAVGSERTRSITGLTLGMFRLGGDVADADAAAINAALPYADRE